MQIDSSTHLNCRSTKMRTNKNHNLTNESFIFLGADTPWVMGLCEALANSERNKVTAFRFERIVQYLKASKIHLYQDGQLMQKAIPVPPSYGTRLHWLTRPYLIRILNSEYRKLSEITQRSPWVVVTNPVAERWTRCIPNDQLIYWNYDDYRLYQPRRLREIEMWEDILIERARIVLCASRTQRDRFHERFPQWSTKCFHFPNAVRRESISANTNTIINAATVGYVGNLGDRVDWRLVYQIASSSLNLRFIFVGEIEEEKSKSTPDWKVWRGRVLSLGNVESVGKVPQEQVRYYYESCSVNWMPYDITHPFNIASCPTKIFDALASGRPFVSTAVPESLLYPDHISIIVTAEEGVRALSLAASETDDRLVEQRASFARRNDWNGRAEFLLNFLSEPKVQAQTKK